MIYLFKLRSELLRIVMSVGRSVCGKNQNAKYQLAIYGKYSGNHWRTHILGESTQLCFFSFLKAKKIDGLN